MAEPLKVTVYDPATGETASKDLNPGDYVLVCAAPCHLAHTQAQPTKGTHVLTINGYTGDRRG